MIYNILTHKNILSGSRFIRDYTAKCEPFTVKYEMGRFGTETRKLKILETQKMFSKAKNFN